MASRLNRCGPQAKFGSRARVFFFQRWDMSEILPFDSRMRPWQNVTSQGQRSETIINITNVACQPAAYARNPMGCVSHEQ